MKVKDIVINKLKAQEKFLKKRQKNMLKHF